MRIIKIILLLFISFNSYSQERIRPAIWVGPMDNVKVHGVNITPLVFKIAENVTINGINIEGIGIPIFLFMMPGDPIEKIKYFVPKRKFNVNGLSFSPAGLIQEGRVNGLTITPWFSYTDEANGFAFAGFGNMIIKCNGLMVSGYFNSSYISNGMQIGTFNNSKKMEGIQIGIINNSENLKGIQIGLWNVNSKRKLPFINWSL